MTLVDEIITHLILPSGWKFPANQLTKEPLNLDLKKGQSQGRGRRAGTSTFQAGGVVKLWGLSEARAVHVGTLLLDRVQAGRVGWLAETDLW